jgi:uncharacterized protein
LNSPFIKAAQQNFSPAQVLLGDRYLKEINTSKSNNYDLALKLFKLSIERQDKNYQKFKKTINKDYQLTYKKRIVRFRKEVIKKSLYKAYFSLGTMSSKGLGIPQSYKMAMEYYKKAGEGIGMAYYNISLFYFNGQGVKKDFKKAKKFCIKGSSRGVIDCRFMLGSIFLKGLDVPQDYKEAAKWFKLAVNHPASLYNLGFLYFNGLGVPQNHKTAINYFTSAATNGSKEAKIVLEKLLSEK